MEAALADLFSNLWSPSTPSLLPPPPPLPQTHPNPPQPSQDHTPEGTSTLQRHLFLACLPAYDICDPSPGTPLVPCAAKAQVVLPAAPHRRAPGLSPPSARPLPVSRPLPPVSLVPDHHLSAVSVDLQGGSGPDCCHCLAKKKQATDKTSTRQASEISCFLFIFHHARDTKRDVDPGSDLF